MTELEKGMFKKARLENYSIGSGSGGISELFKPRFSKRSTNGKTILQGIAVVKPLILKNINENQLRDL